MALMAAIRRSSSSSSASSSSLLNLSLQRSFSSNILSSSEIKKLEKDLERENHRWEASVDKKMNIFINEMAKMKSSADEISVKFDEELDVLEHDFKKRINKKTRNCIITYGGLGFVIGVAANEIWKLLL